MLALGVISEEANTSTGTSDTNVVSGATPEEVRDIVEDAIVDYETRQAVTMEEIAAENANLLAGLQSGIEENHTKLLDIGKDVEKVTTGTVSISEDQWTTMQECWGWAKGLGSVALFLALVGTLLMAAMFGAKLWDHFTKGWRR